MADEGSKYSNLDCFLNYITPVVSPRLLPKGEMRKLNKLWHPWEKEKVEYFKLSDLWDCYDEWSAYGVGVPILLTRSEETEALVQYYVPYLSALQIFTSNPFHNFREDTDSNGEASVNESESEKSSHKYDECSSCGSSEHDQIWHPNDKFGYLYCQYFEEITPYGRVPLMEKVRSLVPKYPGLMSLRSVDLSPASWMAVSWYPIYHIPMWQKINDLNTCFLSYHTLSSIFQDMDPEDEVEGGVDAWRKDKDREGISLPPFGLATYKMQGSLWVSGREGRDRERLVSLEGVADSWLKQLGVHHHDFNYFTRIRRI